MSARSGQKTHRGFVASSIGRPYEEVNREIVVEVVDLQPT